MCLYNDHCDHQCVLSRLSGLWDNILLQTLCRKRGVKIQTTRTPSATPIWCVVQLVRTRRIRVWCCSSPAGLSPCSLWPLRSPTRTWLCRPAHANSHAVRATVVLKWINEPVHSYTYRSYRTWCFFIAAVKTVQATWKRHLCMYTQCCIVELTELHMFCRVYFNTVFICNFI